MLSRARCCPDYFCIGPKLFLLQTDSLSVSSSWLKRPAQSPFPAKEEIWEAKAPPSHRQLAQPVSSAQCSGDSCYGDLKIEQEPETWVPFPVLPTDWVLIQVHSAPCPPPPSCMEHALSREPHAPGQHSAINEFLFASWARCGCGSTGSLELGIHDNGVVEAESHGTLRIRFL
jgi:hypothetical protein